jgi:hypothetical protein
MSEAEHQAIVESMRMEAAREVCCTPEHRQIQVIVTTWLF